MELHVQVYPCRCASGRTPRHECRVCCHEKSHVTVLTDDETCDHRSTNSSCCKKSQYQESFEPGHKRACGTKHCLHYAGDYQRLFTAKSEKLSSSLALSDNRNLAAEAEKLYK
jgi:hypothetical protein